MQYTSTRNNIVKITAAQAILRGLAPDGGLYVPEKIKSPDISEQQLLRLSQTELTARVLHALIDDLDLETLERAVKDGYRGKFENDDNLTPLVKCGKDYVLELYRGPTSAFKDMALCLLPRLIAASAEKCGAERDTMILTATSGDTGKAALAGFAGAPKTKVIVFYPDGGVSDIQRLQMVTQQGDNVCVCAVRGNFDDAQTGVKRAFGELKCDGFSLSSANSINIGRLAPQVAYYFKAYADLVKAGEIKYGDLINFVVPTGNFGNILAGYIAKKMGLPIGKFVCASNRNDVLTQFLSTGVYDKRRPFYLTASPSMDILVSSNLERLIYFASGGDTHLVASLMADLNEKGFYKVPGAVLSEIKNDFLCGSADDEECFKTIKKTFDENHYLIDPHTSVAFAVLTKVRGNLTGKTVILSTASAYKFAPAMLKAFGIDSVSDGFAAMEKLNELTGVPIPKNLALLREMEILHKDIINPDEITEYVERKAKSWEK